MTLTVERLLSEVGLQLAAGQAAAGAPVRSVHSTELLDPTPWLTGGELLLTTGIQLDCEQRQRELRRAAGGARDRRHRARRRLHARRAARRPAVGCRRACAAGLRSALRATVETITERAYSHLISEQYDALRRSTDIQGRLERLVLEAALTVLDARGLVAVRGPLLCAIVDSGAGWRDPIELARKLRAELAIDEPGVRAAAQPRGERPVAAAQLPRGALRPGGRSLRQR